MGLSNFFGGFRDDFIFHVFTIINKYYDFCRFFGFAYNDNLDGLLDLLILSNAHVIEKFIVHL